MESVTILRSPRKPFRNKRERNTPHSRSVLRMNPEFVSHSQFLRCAWRAGQKHEGMEVLLSLFSNRTTLSSSQARPFITYWVTTFSSKNLTFLRVWLQTQDFRKPFCYHFPCHTLPFTGPRPYMCPGHTHDSSLCNAWHLSELFHSSSFTSPITVMVAWLYSDSSNGIFTFQFGSTLRMETKN